MLAVVCLTLLGPPPASALPSGIIAVDLCIETDFPEIRLREFMTSFQGIVNRSEPRLFVIIQESDYYWLDRLESDYGISHTILDSPWDVFDNPTLMALCNQVIICSDTDPELTINAAITMAGEYGTAMAWIKSGTSDLKDIQSAGFTVHTDLRGDFTSNEQVQSWTHTNYRALTRDDITGISPGKLTSRNWAVDYFVMNNIMLWCLDNKPVFLRDKDTTQRTILGSYTAPIPAFGTWVTEGTDVEAISDFGHYQVGDARNLSVFSQLPALTGEIQTSDAPPVYETNKKYVLFSFTQGDAMGFNQQWNLDNLLQMSATIPGVRVANRYPFGLFQGTSSVNMQPNVVKGCYAIKTGKQYFTGKPLGYTDPMVMQDNGTLAIWCTAAVPHLQKMGYPDIMINDGSAEADASHASMNTLCSMLQPRSVIYKHALHPATDEEDEPEYIAGVPVFGDPVFARDCSDLDDPDFDVAATKEAVLASAAKRQFFWVFLDHTDTAVRLEQLLDSLAATNPEIVPVNTAQLAELYTASFPPPVKTEFSVIADAFVSQANPMSNYGPNEDVRVRGAASGREIISYLKFSVSGLTGAVPSAKLKVYAKDDINDTAVKSVADTSWVESSINWNTRPPVGEQLDSIAPVSTNRWYEFNVTDAVTGDGTYSFALTSTQDIASRDWDSKEGIGNSAVLQIETGATNHAPSFNSDPFAGADATKDHAYNGTIASQTFDPDPDDPLVYSKQSGPEWLAVASDGLLSGTPANGDIGTHSFVVRATDTGGLYDEATLNISVMEEPAPVIQEPEMVPDGTVVIRWESISNHYYTVHHSTNLLTGFSVLQSNIPATPSVNSCTDNVNGVQQTFWTVTTEP